MTLYGVEDHWASPTETLSRHRGDCEDYAILEMMLLQAAGFRPSDTYLTIGFDQIAHRDHALLSVNINNVMWTLDQRVRSPLPTATVADFRPILTLSGGSAWLHGYRMKSGDSQLLMEPLTEALERPKSFEKRIQSYYSESFWMVHFYQWLAFLVVLWTGLKILFYVLPVFGLLRVLEREIEISTGHAPSVMKRIIKRAVILLFILPIIDVFAYFYIVSNVVGKIRIHRINLSLRCQIYGLGAGILGLFWTQDLFNFTLMSGGFILTGQVGFQLYTSSVIFATWLLFSINHVHHVYLIHQEIDRRIARKEAHAVS